MHKVLFISIFISFCFSNGTANKLTCYEKQGPDTRLLGGVQKEQLRECNGEKETCFLFLRHSTPCSRSYPVHGCISKDDVPVECRTAGIHFEPFYNLTVDGETIMGSFKCCGHSYCNEIKEPLFTPIHYRVDPPNTFKMYIMMPILMCLLVGVNLLPLISKRLNYQKELNNSVEGTGLLPLDPCGLKTLVEERMIPGNITGYFKSLKNIHDCIQKIEAETTGAEKNGDTEREKKRAKKGLSAEAAQKVIKVKPIVTAYQSSIHGITRAERSHPSKRGDLLSRLIEMGPYEIDFDPNELGDLFDEMSTILAEEETVLTLDGDIYVVGNLEGSYRDLFRWFSTCDWPPRVRYLFLGGVVNSDSPSSLETIVFLFALKRALPKHIYILRGEAEGLPLCIGHRGFPTRIVSCLQEVASKALSMLPLAAIIEKKILCVHGSIPAQLKSLDALCYIKRPLVNVERKSLEGRVFLSYPEDVYESNLKIVVDQGASPSREGVALEAEVAVPQSRPTEKRNASSLVFLPEEVDGTLERLGLEMMIRAKSPCLNGISFLSPRIISVWSAPSCMSSLSGCRLHIDTDLSISVDRLHRFGSFNSDNVEAKPLDIQGILESLDQGPSQEARPSTRSITAREEKVSKKAPAKESKKNK